MARIADQDAGETQKRLRDSAIELFAAKGFHGTGIREIAMGAGVTVSSLYHHFGSKDDLLVDIMFESTVPLQRAAAAVVDEYPDPASAICLLIEQHVWAHVDDRLAKIVADTEIRSLTDDRLTRVLELRDTYENSWRTVVQAGVKAGTFEVADITAASIGLLEMCTSVSNWYRPTGRLSLGALCATYSDLGLGLLRATNGQGKPLRRRDLDLPRANREFLGRH